MKKRLVYIILSILILVVATFSLVQWSSAGKLYTLTEAYDNGWLTDADIKNIAYYYRDVVVDGGLEDENYVPAPKTPERLNIFLQNKIKKAYIKEYGVDNVFIPITISDYYGTYNDCVVVNVRQGGDPYFEDFVIIGEVVIRSYSPHFIKVWRAD